MWSAWDPEPAKACDKSLKTLDANQRPVIAGFEKASDALLIQKVVGRRYTFGQFICCIIQHGLYHLEIALLKKG